MSAFICQTERTQKPSNQFIFRTSHGNIQKLLLALGFPQHVYGYEYIIYALELIERDHNSLYHITKELYPEIARHFETTPNRVERAIRTAIQIAWSEENIPLINSIFGNTLRSESGAPTNSQLLAGLHFFLKHSEMDF